jgi:hypothetical protein
LTGLFLPQGAPGNIFDKAVYVSVPAVGGDGPLQNRLAANRLATGINFKMGSFWNGGVEYSHASRNQYWRLLVGSSAADAVRAGDLDVFQDLSKTELALAPFAATLFAPELVSRTSAWSIRMAGPLAKLSAGDVTLSGLLERRTERFRGGVEYMGMHATDAMALSLLTPQTRTINSAHVQLGAPIRLAGITQRPIELQLAGRFDDYVTDTAPPRVNAIPTDTVPRRKSRFQTANPTIGAQFHAFTKLAFRGSFGTGFVPPSGDQLAPPVPRRFSQGAFRDARRGNELTGLVDLQAGGNPSLNPERSRSWSAGAFLVPGTLGDLQLSLDYVEITKSNNIVSPADLAMTNLPLFEARYPQRVTREPASQNDIYGVGPITAIDASDINVAQARIRAWDLDAQFGLPAGKLGHLDFVGHVTWQPEFSTQATPNSPAENDIAVTANAPLRLGAVSNVTLSRGPIQLSWTTRYFGQYQVSRNPTTLANQGARKIPHQTYHDLSLVYELPLNRFVQEGIDLQATVQNVFDREPPFDAGTVHYFSPFGDPRGAVYAVSVQARF